MDERTDRRMGGGHGESKWADGGWQLCPWSSAPLPPVTDQNWYHFLSLHFSIIWNRGNVAVRAREKECEELLSDWWVTESAIFIINSRRKGKLCHFYTLKCVYGSWGEQLHMRWSNEAASNLMNCTPMRSLCGWVAVWVMYAPGFERGYMSFFRGIWSDQLFFNYPQWVQTVSSMP